MVRIEKWHTGEEPTNQLEAVTLYDGAVVTSGNVELSEAHTSFEYIVVSASFVASGETYVQSKTLTKADLAESYIYQILEFTAAGSSTSMAQVRVNAGDSTETTLAVEATSVTYTSAGIYKVVGYKKRYTTQNTSDVIPVNGGNPVSVGNRYPVQLPADYYNSDGTIKDGVSLAVQLDINGAVFSGFADVTSGHIYNSGSSQHIFYGAEVKKAGDKVYVYTAGYDQVAGSSLTLVHSGYNDRPWDVGVNQTSAPCQIIAKLNDQLPITVQKGLGGLVKSAAQNIGTLSATPVQVTFDTVAFTKYFRMVTQNVANGTLAHGLEGSWRTDLVLNCSFESSNAVRHVTFEVYRVSDGQTVETDTVELLRNQTSQKLWMNRVFEILKSDVDYAIRVASADGVNTFVINSARWTTTLVMS